MAADKPVTTVKDLIDWLKLYNPDSKVFIASDEEGNQINKIHQVARTSKGGKKPDVIIWPY